MANILESIITVVFGTINTVTRTVSGGISALQDFFLVRIGGVSFVVLGARQTGKTTLIEWLKRNMNDVSGFETEPTPAGGAAVPDFTSKVGESHMKLKPVRDVGGEFAMWETDWVELFRQAQPRGIIFLMDHTDIYMHKDALNFVMQMIDDEPGASRNLKAVYLMVNKSDLWGEEMSLDDIMSHYRNEQKRLKSQSERVGYKCTVFEGSLHTGKGVTFMMRKFFNTLRPHPKEKV